MARPPDEPLECPDCPDPHLTAYGHRSCHAHKSTRRPDGTKQACGNYPITGGTVCRQTHGGNAPQVRAAAARRVRDAHVTEILRLNVRDVDPAHSSRSPDEQLLDEVARSAQMVEWLAERVADLDVPDLRDTGAFAGLAGVDADGEVVEHVPRNNLIGPNHNGEAAPHVYWVMLNEERVRHAKFADTAIKAGISERLVRLAEHQGQQMVSVIRATVDAIPGLTPDQRVAAMRVAASKLRAIGSSPKVIDQ